MRLSEVVLTSTHKNRYTPVNHSFTDSRGYTFHGPVFHMTKMAAMPIYDKKTSAGENLLLWNRSTNFNKTWHVHVALWT